MKNASLVLALALLIATPVLAGDKCCPAKDGKNGKGDYAEKKVERLKEKLSLTDAQTEQVKGIVEAGKQKAIALKEESHAQIAAVLTPEQKEKYEAMKADWKEKGKDDHKDA